MTKTPNPIIIIDAGHGGLMPDGNYATAPNKLQHYEADGRQTFLHEGVLNRAVAYGLSFQLDFLGLKNYVIGSNADTSLSDRTDFINYHHKDKNAFLISVHHNWHEIPQAHGAEFFTYAGITPLSDAIAQEAGQIFIEKFNNTRKLRLDGNGVNPHSDKLVFFKKRNFQILRETIVPAILTEFGFMSNPTEYKYISSYKGIQDQIEFLVQLCQSVIDKNLIQNHKN